MALQAIKLEVTERKSTGKGANRRMRVSKRIPGVVYGLKQESMNISLDPRDIVPILVGERGKSTLLQLNVDGKDAGVALVRDYQIHPVKRKLMHVDLMRVEEGTQLNLKVPLHLVGISRMVKEGGAKQVQLARDVEVICTPEAIPAALEYDVSPLDRKIVIYADEVELPAGVSKGYRYNFPILSLSMPKAEIEEAQDADEAAEGEGGTEDSSAGTASSET